MTNRERMNRNMIYDGMDPELMEEQQPLIDRVADYNATRWKQFDKRGKMLKGMFAEMGENCYIEPPFYANWGGSHVHVGNNFYANFSLTLVDDGHIYIGDSVMIGPNVTLATAAHPIGADLRSKGYQYNEDIRIGDNVWIGAGAILVPGVTVGANTVIGAGSVVTKDIPENVVAVGNPCRVMREIGENDRKYYAKGKPVDIE